MPELRSEREAARAPTDRRVEPDAGPIPYPVGQVVAIIDTPAQAAAALHALTGGGFLTSEVTLVCGAQAADRLHASSGRAGLFGRMLRVADRLGVWDEELEARHEYEQALRGGGFDFAVLAPTEERKQLAARILRAHGGHFINYFGRLTIQRLE